MSALQNINEMSKDVIRVVIPVYNTQKYLKRCIESVINQSYTSLEIILVDDGSTDNSPLICDTYAQNDKRISVIHKKNGGPSSARNAGIDLCKKNNTAKYIAFVDSDDYIAFNFIEQLYVTLKTSNSDISVCRFARNESDIDYDLCLDYTVFKPKEAIKECFQDGKIITSACAKLYKIGLFDGIYFPLGICMEDYAAIYRLLDKCKSISLVNTKKYFYTRNPASITQKSFNKSYLDYFVASEAVLNFCRQKYPELMPIVKSREVTYALVYYIKYSFADIKDKRHSDIIIKKIRGFLIQFLLRKNTPIKKLLAIAFAFAPILFSKLLYKYRKQLEPIFIKRLS